MKQAWKYLLYASLIIAGGLLLYLLGSTIYLKNTGFEGKSLWDWLELVIVPLFLALGAIIIGWWERKTERELSADRQQEAALQAYIDRMGDLLLKEKLRTTKNKEVRNVARIRTLTVLRGLDPRRKGFVLRFLHEAGLINKDKTIVDLDGADLSNTRLVNADLTRTRLVNTYLFKADLVSVDLTDANLTNAKLYYTNLVNANLTNANLTNTNLSNADLRGADLTNADLTNARIMTSLVTEKQLADAKSLKHAFMPDYTQHE